MSESHGVIMGGEMAGSVIEVVRGNGVGGTDLVELPSQIFSRRFISHLPKCLLADPSPVLGTLVSSQEKGHK